MRATAELTWTDYHISQVQVAWRRQATGNGTTRGYGEPEEDPRPSSPRGLRTSDKTNEHSIAYYRPAY